MCLLQIRSFGANPYSWANPYSRASPYYSDMKSIGNPLFFDVTLSQEIIPFFSYDPQSELSKREVIDLILGEQYIEFFRMLKEIRLELTSPVEK